MSISAETIYIETLVGDMLHADSRQAGELFHEMVAAIDIDDDHLLETFMSQPAQAVVAEVDYLQRLYLPRVIHSRRGLATFAEFVTRNADCTGIETRYRTQVTPSKAPIVTVTSYLRGQLEQPCTIAVANGTLEVTEPKYERGTHLHLPSKRSEKLQRAFFASTIWAAHMAIERPLEEKPAADAQARALLATEIVREFRG